MAEGLDVTRHGHERLAEYNSAFKGWVYSQAWIDLLVEKLSSPDGYREVTGCEPVAVAPRQ